MQDPTNNDAEEVTDALIRSTLRDQARIMGRVKIPHRGTTKPALKGNGNFAKRSRAALTSALRLRALRRRWFKGDFTQEEIEQTREWLAQVKDQPENRLRSIIDAAVASSTGG